MISLQVKIALPTGKSYSKTFKNGVIAAAGVDDNFATDFAKKMAAVTTGDAVQVTRSEYTVVDIDE